MFNHNPYSGNVKNGGATENSPKGAQTLLNGLSLVRYVAGGAKDAPELQRLSGLPRSTVHRLLQALKSEGYVRDTVAGLGLGPTLIELGFGALSSNPLAAVAGPHLDNLAAQVLDTVHMAVRDNGSVLYLAKISGQRGAEMRSQVGLRMPLTRTGIGKALLLDDDAAAWVERWRAETPADDAAAAPAASNAGAKAEDDFVARMHHYRKGGYSYDMEENEPGIRCVAAPVRDGSRSIVGAISVSATAPYMPANRMRELLAPVQGAAAAISAEMGYRQAR
ncbi:IclR family transcriptional regulator [Pseudarthrobacter sp. C4D7]|uniref:IclR family transcriptional regulator n=1 Tax=Pseudarthrobacter sp. C4D7 TaxID=2735268 RepID=UPI00158529F2|nr:IclR family transcriptional regulator [Pseudarthrobacter sp. C4D7]NUT73301.1 IclR family transcriptional regulator [Pseudarthrobacter sp. C4D7]